MNASDNMPNRKNVLETNKFPELYIEEATDVESLVNDDIETIDAEDLKAEDIRTGYLPMPSGRALSLQETYNVMAIENTVSVVLIGPSESGKTTIETTLYQLFQRGKVLNFLFAGSKTLQGYEERAFYTRVISREKVSATPRTSRGLQEVFLHLCLFDEQKKHKTNYLFADLSGEEIQTYIADVDGLTQNMPFMRQTNNYTVILDGERLSKKNQRNGVFDETSTMLRTIFDAGLYSSSTKLQIVISKYDIIEENILVQKNTCKEIFKNCI